MGCLYQLTSPGGKSYIGISSKSTEDRWAKHTEHAFGMRNPETAAKVKAAAQRRSADPEWRARISASKTGKKIAPRSDIAKQRQSEGMKAAWARRKAEKLNKGETIVP